MFGEILFEEGGNRVNTWGKSHLRGGDGEVPRQKCVLAEPEALQGWRHWRGHSEQESVGREV